VHRFPDVRRDDGFTLIEVLVAFLIIAIVAAAGTTLTVRGLRATLDAKQLSQAKNLVSEQVEQMRGLPYAVANTTNTSKVDVLDRYFPNLTAAGAPTCSADAATWIANKSAWSGFVSVADRCPFEPSNGAFYRTVVDPSVSGASPTAVVVATQFLGLASGTGSDAPSITPPTGYAWDATGLDTPASAQIAAHVTAVYGPPGVTAKYTTSRTDIADRRAGPPLVSAETNAAAVVVDGTLATGGSQRLELGTVAGNGGVTAITKAAVEAVGGSMQTDTGRDDGAAQLATSPGSVSGSASKPELWSGGLYIGATQTSGVNATSTVSDPGYGTAVGSAASGSFSVDQIDPSVGLNATDPIVKVDASSGTPGMPGGGACPSATSSSSIAGAGWMNTGTTSPLTLGACAQSEAATVQLFPTAGAPDGLIQAEASDVLAHCAISGSTPTATTSGTVKVRWLTGSPTTYSSWTVITLGSPTPLPALTTPLGNGETIGRYIDSWAAFSGAGQTTSTADGRAATARVPAALTLSTVPLRKLTDGSLDPESAVTARVGQAQCSATDRRS
jgi:prepilin-type N-terminal cleavage/methylation domain-containing protein